MFINFDQAVFQYMFTIRHAWATPLMIFVTHLFGPSTLPLFALLLIVWFWRQKDKPTVLLIVFSLGGGFLLEVLLKMIVARPRPAFGLITETDYSFPSGHATLGAIFFGLLIFLFKDKIKNQTLRWLYIAGNVFVCLLVGFSRLYLGVHWFSDVLAGFFIGTVWFLLLKTIFTKKLINVQLSAK